jgi:ribosomal protein S18 acetylase RimI-like enzyme
MTNIETTVIQIREYKPNKKREISQLLKLLVDFDVEVNHSGMVDRGHSRRERKELEPILQELKQAKNNWCIVADYNGGLAGFSLIRRYEDNADLYRTKGVFELLAYYVLPKFRRKKVANYLIATSLKKMQQEKPKPICQVIAEVKYDNQSSKRLYQKFRFRLLQKREAETLTDYLIYSKLI